MSTGAWMAAFGIAVAVLVAGEVGQAIADQCSAVRTVLVAAAR